MRYCIQPATSVDVAFLAAVMDENREQWTGDGEAVPIDRLLQTLCLQRPDLGGA